MRWVLPCIIAPHGMKLIKTAGRYWRCNGKVPDRHRWVRRHLIGTAAIFSYLVYWLLPQAKFRAKQLFDVWKNAVTKKNWWGKNIVLWQTVISWQLCKVIHSWIHYNLSPCAFIIVYALFIVHRWVGEHPQAYFFSPSLDFMRSEAALDDPETDTAPSVLALPVAFQLWYCCKAL